MIAETPDPPYFAVIFSSIQTDDLQGYAEMAQRMEILARQQSGYLGFESVRNGLGIAVSYWQDEASMLAWKNNAEHLIAQDMGHSKWYLRYTVRIARVYREYGK